MNSLSCKKIAPTIIDTAKLNMILLLIGVMTVARIGQLDISPVVTPRFFIFKKQTNSQKSTQNSWGLANLKQLRPRRSWMI